MKSFTVLTLVVMNTLAAPQLRQTTVTSSDVSLLEDDLPNSQSNCRGEHCEDKKETLIKYINTSDKKGYHFTYETSKHTKVSQTGVLVPHNFEDHHGCDRSSGAGCSPGATGLLSDVADGLTQLDLKLSKKDIGKIVLGGKLAAPLKCPGQSNVLCPNRDCDKCDEPPNQVMIIPDGHYEFNTPDCFHVYVSYSAGFEGFKIKEQTVNRDPGCKMLPKIETGNPVQDRRHPEYQSPFLL